MYQRSEFIHLAIQSHVFFPYIFLLSKEEFLSSLLESRVPPGVDEAAYVKAGFLTAIAKGEATSPILLRALVKE